MSIDLSTPTGRARAAEYLSLLLIEALMFLPFYLASFLGPAGLGQ